MCQRILMRWYASSTRREKSSYEKKISSEVEKDYKGLQRAGVAHPVWPTHQLRHSLEEMSVCGLTVI